MLYVLLFILLISLPLAGVGIVAQLLSRKRLGLVYLTALTAGLVIVPYLVFGWTFVTVAGGMPWPSLIASFLVTWFLVTAGSRFTYGFREGLSDSKDYQS